MNKLTALAFTLAFSVGGASTSFASNMNDQAPQVKDLNAQEMSSAVGAGRIYWRTAAPRTRLFQADGRHAPHQATVPRTNRWRLLSGHNIRAGQFVQVWCRGYTMRSARFRMPNRNIGLSCR